ncbi:peptidase MA family metallohydrolase [Gottfriedia acidiceleris]|uniref:peptidase MA family metallohydrolase n=1 Tax=Gottfriedia acidiceleris TaxID=371036 RepID=UPI00143047CD|nr:collagenase [Gottfriedia acidiceleris]
MKRFIKIFGITLSSILFIVFLFVIGLGMYVHKTLENKAQEKLPFVQSIKMFLTANFEGKNEKEFKETRLKEKFHNVTIYYPNDFSELIPITKEALNWAINKNKEVFGTVEVKPVDLIVFKDKKEMQELSGLVDVSGIYSDFDKLLAIKFDNKEAILERKETPLYFFQKSILHEYTHYIFSRKVVGTKAGASAYPLWFNEGISEYIGNDKTIVEPSNFKVVSFEQLVNDEKWQTARFQDGTNVYMQSYFAIKFLVANYGEGVLKKIINSTNSSGNFGKSFEKTTGLTFNELEDKFLSAYK